MLIACFDDRSHTANLLFAHALAGDWERQTDQTINESSRRRIVTADDEQRTVVVRETTIQATDKTRVLGSATLLAGAIVQIAEGDYSLATQAGYVVSIGKSASIDIGQSLTEKIGQLRSSVAGARQDIIAPVVWVGSQQLNVMQLMLDTLDVVQELAKQTVQHNHANTGAPINAAEITATGTTGSLQEKYRSVIG